jgi:hypothetical protein
MAEIIISCAGDVEFAKEVYDYFHSGLEDQQKFEEGRSMRINKELISLSGDEIHVDSKSLIPKGMIKWILKSLLKSNPERFKEYGVIEFEDSFTVGVVLQPGNIEGLHTCEFCGHFTPYAEELYTHRMTHYGGG